MKAIIENQDIIRDLSVITTLIEEGEFKATEKEMTFKAMDASQLVMIDWQENADSFTKLEKGCFCVNNTDFAAILARTGKAKVTLETKDNQLTIKTEKDGMVKKFVLPMIDNPHGHGTPITKTPKIEFKAKTEITSSDFKKSLGDINLFATHYHMTITKNGLKLFSNNDGREVEINTPKKSLESLTPNKEPQKVLMNTELVKNFTDKTSGNLEFNIATNAPMKITAGSLDYYIAPRIEED